MGEIDEPFDRECIRHFEAGDGRPLVDFLNERLPTIGNGAAEIRNWVAAHGAAGERGFELIGYCNCPERLRRLRVRLVGARCRLRARRREDAGLHRLRGGQGHRLSPARHLRLEGVLAPPDGAAGRAGISGRGVGRAGIRPLAAARSLHLRRRGRGRRAPDPERSAASATSSTATAWAARSPRAFA